MNNKFYKLIGLFVYALLSKISKIHEYRKYSNWFQFYLPIMEINNENSWIYILMLSLNCNKIIIKSNHNA